MNQIEIIRNKKLPPDSLDNKGDKFLALFAPAIGCLGFGLALFFNWGPLNEPEYVKAYCFTFFLALAAYTIYAFNTERNIDKVVTGLSLAENLLLVNQSLKELKWADVNIDDKFTKTVQIDSWGMNKGYKLVIIIDDDAVYFNVRNRGSYKGRLPYAFGGNTFYALKFRNKIITTNLKLKQA
ncbi:hypothetical protein [Hymenobacter sp.]|uniref:hypothetical protein n=1 Tax=Hymenobacter sp. TaxID=1898978 RepID=UPI00286A99C2|nr:hypothetical protein [Hymenobacter sp.]